MQTNNKISLKKPIKYLRKEAEKIAKKKEISLFNPSNVMSEKKVQKLLHELQVHQIELEMQNDELLLTQEQLQNSQKRYFNLYNMAPIGYFTLNEENLILEANNAASDMLGLNHRVLTQKLITDFIVNNEYDSSSVETAAQSNIRCGHRTRFVKYAGQPN